MDKKTGILSELEENLALIPIGIALVLTLLSLVMKPFASEEAITLVLQISYYAYGWIASLAVALCARNRSHMRAPLVERILPENLRRYVGLLSDLVTLIVLVGMLYGTFQGLNAALAAQTMNSKAPQLPMSVVYFAPIVGFAAGTIRHIQSMMKGAGK